MVKNIYVGNLSFRASEDELKGLFEQYGAVSSVNIITDRETGRSRGFGFVEMENGEKAISELDGSDFLGRSLRINEAQSQRPRRGREI